MKLTISFISLAFSIACVASTPAADFTFKGAITTTYFNAAGGTSNLVATFSLAVSDCKWWFKVTPPPGDVAYCEAANDGELTRQYISLESLLANKFPVLSANNAMASIHSDPFPKFSAARFSSMPWLGLAGKCFLETNSGPVKPFYHLDLTDLRPVEFTATFTDNTHAFPRRIFFYRTANSKSRSVANASARITNAVFEVLASTNIAGQLIPIHFSLTHYAEVRMLPSQLRIDVVHDVRVVDVITNCSSTFVPDIPATHMAFFSDLRFADASDGGLPILNYITNRWLSKEEATKVPGKRDQIISHRLAERAAANLGSQHP